MDPIILASFLVGAATYAALVWDKRKKNIKK